MNMTELRVKFLKILEVSSPIQFEDLQDEAIRRLNRVIAKKCKEWLANWDENLAQQVQDADKFRDFITGDLIE